MARNFGSNIWKLNREVCLSVYDEGYKWLRTAEQKMEGAALTLALEHISSSESVLRR